jgi:SNF2 family DNA or RNA helicase
MKMLLSMFLLLATNWYINLSRLIANYNTDFCWQITQDQQYFQRVKWQYMILDEAQNIKNSSSARWKTLLGFQCRNRLLLTGTPIQNNMQGSFRISIKISF